MRDATATRSTLVIGEDDPALVGRTLQVDPDAITFHIPDGPGACAGASSEPVAETAATLVAGTMAGRADPPAIPTPADYGLPVVPATPLTVHWLHCRSGAIGPGFGPHDNTFLVALPDSRLAMGWNLSTLLILARSTGPARPSFNCGKATLPAERTICGSPGLSAEDASVARAYADDARQFSGIGDPAAAARLKSSQATWLRVRNRCGASAACLMASMSDRIRDLQDTRTFTGE